MVGVERFESRQKSAGIIPLSGIVFSALSTLSFPNLFLMARKTDLQNLDIKKPLV